MRPWILSVVVFTLLGCAHERALQGPLCSVPERDLGWQVDRVEPPWAVLVDIRDESILVHQDCFERLWEGMILVEARVDHEEEKLWSARIREKLFTLTRKTEY